MGREEEEGGRQEGEVKGVGQIPGGVSSEVSQIFLFYQLLTLSPLFPSFVSLSPYLYLL